MATSTIDITSSASPSFEMDSDMDANHALSFEIWDYYEKVSKGLIEERPYEYWGPETAEEKAHWHQWWLPIKKSFHPVHWDSGFTGRDIAKDQKKAIERPGLVGPTGEMLVMDEDPLTNAIVWRVDGCSSSEAKGGNGMKKVRSILEAAKEPLIALICTKRSMSALSLRRLWSDAMNMCPTNTFTSTIREIFEKISRRSSKP